MAQAKPPIVKGKRPHGWWPWPIMWRLLAANARVGTMRKAALAVLGLVGLTAVAVAIWVDRRAAPPQPMEKAETLPLATSVPEAQPAGTQPAISAPPPPAAKPAAPDLPTIEVAVRPVHTVPEEETPSPKVTLFNRAGQEITSRHAALTPPPPPMPAPSVAPFGGAAQAAGGTLLAVAGKSVRLFGVRVADPRDQCGLGPGDNRNCSDVARDALAQRLRRNPAVSCHMPEGQRGDPAAICVDANGTDLGGFLVAEGLALADTGQSYEYFGPEGVARYFGRGLWRHRR